MEFCQNNIAFYIHLCYTVPVQMRLKTAAVCPDPVRKSYKKENHMKAFIRSMAFALSLLMLAACSPAEKPQDSAEDTTAAAESTTAEETLDPTLRANHFDAIPAEGRACRCSLDP